MKPEGIIVTGQGTVACSYIGGRGVVIKVKRNRTTEEYDYILAANADGPDMSEMVGKEVSVSGCFTKMMSGEFPYQPTMLIKEYVIKVV